MKVDRRFAFGLAAVLLLVTGWAAVAAAVVWATLEPPARQTIAALLADRLALVLMTWLIVAGAAAWAFRGVYEHYVQAPARLGEAAETLLGSRAERALQPIGSRETRALAATFNALLGQRGELRSDIERKVREASRDIEQERNRLAALMSELTESVVVCNLDGRILLYNQRARLQFRALSQAPALSGGAELIGIGRSVYGVFDRPLVAHALESIEQRMRRGAASPAAQFVTTTPAGQLLRVQMAPVRSTADAGQGAAGISGFVLMLANITHDFETDTARDRLLNALAEGGRASLGNLQAAVDMLDYPDLEPAMRERFHGVIRDEVRTMSRRVQELANEAARDIRTRWPLEDMLGADLVSAALRRIEATGLHANDAGVDAALWLRVDSFSLLQALCYLARRLADEFEVRLVQLRLQPAGEHRARLDLVWSGHAMSTETVMSWETDPMRIGDDSLPLTVREVVERHGGAFWFERERVRQQSFFRFLLPLASAEAPGDAPLGAGDSRPEYYDFDLFDVSEPARALDDRLLTTLAYTVFDTETTGLDPSKGDEIIQIGATRIVNGRLLHSESFDRLVDPQRPIPRATIPIHGISDDMVAGQPTIDEVLPAFHRYAQDTVLVAHNAAFDMRFLQLKEAKSGVKFDQPVLDTLLLSAAVHPNQESHALEAIAERLGVAVVGRHTALGDAIVTAEVFLRMIALLAEKGIVTLGEAREAARKTYYARLEY